MVKRSRADRREGGPHNFATLHTSAQGGVKMVHEVTKRTPWPGGASVFRTLEENVGDRATVKVALLENGLGTGKWDTRFRIRRCRG